MSTQGYGVDITMIAGADLSAKQYCAVKLNSSGNIVAAGAGEDAVGILQTKPTSGQAGTVRISGVSKMVAGGSITAGSRVASDANGKAKAAVAATTKTDDTGAAADALVGSYTIGHLLETASADGQIVSVLLSMSGAIPTTAA